MPTEIDLREKYLEIRGYTEQLCEPLETEDYIPQPIVDVSPVKWNIAHTTWFFEEMILKNFFEGYQVFDERFGYLFNSYYNSIGERTVRDRRGDLSRPTVRNVFDYRHFVDEQMKSLLSGAITEEVRELVLLGLNHEQQHQELFLTDLKYTFGVNPLMPAYRPEFAHECTAAAGSGKFIEVSGGMFEIGHAGGGFAFDNELARHSVFLNDFAISDRLVTNAEFVEFIEDGGYREHSLWHAEGWDRIVADLIDSPLYWHVYDGKRHQFTLGGSTPLALDAPVCHISFYEAAAFAEWKGCRLPTEFEWEAACSGFEWGERWEWTNSAYLPYPGYKKAGGAVGEYNGKFMINQMVLRGSSIATPAGHSRLTYRNFFHPHLRWQFTGIRLAK
ncbi:MAG: ergothioneine biosynthesis protein EgtB [Pyrinomonadaceae bacterium]|nr:ergothioneine biosynthesis protein EgtB [Pyrinomonadaceae bacterium]